MSVTALEGIVIEGQIHLATPLRVPDNTKVYVIIPEVATAPVPRIVSPRLLHLEEIADFRKEVIEEPLDANL